MITSSSVHWNNATSAQRMEIVLMDGMMLGGGALAGTLVGVSAMHGFVCGAGILGAHCVWDLCFAPSKGITIKTLAKLIVGIFAGVTALMAYTGTLTIPVAFPTAVLVLTLKIAAIQLALTVGVMTVLRAATAAVTVAALVAAVAAIVFLL